METLKLSREDTFESNRQKDESYRLELVSFWYCLGNCWLFHCVLEWSKIDVYMAFF